MGQLTLGKSSAIGTLNRADWVAHKKQHLAELHIWVDDHAGESKMYSTGWVKPSALKPFADVVAGLYGREVALLLDASGGAIGLAPITTA